MRDHGVGEAPVALSHGALFFLGPGPGGGWPPGDSDLTALGQQGGWGFWVSWREEVCLGSH